MFWKTFLTPMTLARTLPSSTYAFSPGFMPVPSRTSPGTTISLVGLAFLFSILSLLECQLISFTDAVPLVLC